MSNPVRAFISKYSHSGSELRDAFLSNGVDLRTCKDETSRISYLDEEIKNPSSFALQLTGLVIDATNNVLAVHPPQFNRNANLTHVFTHIDEYNVFPIHYGTVVTLYWYNEKWEISTRRAVKSTDFRNTSMAQVFEAALIANGLAPNPFNPSIADIRDRMDKKLCYSFIIYGKELQYFDSSFGKEGGDDRREIWFICSRDPRELSLNWDRPEFLDPRFMLTPLRPEEATFEQISAKLFAIDPSDIGNCPIEKLAENGMGFILRKKNQNPYAVDTLQDNLIIKNAIYKRVDQLIGKANDMEQHIVRLIGCPKGVDDFKNLFPLERKRLDFLVKVRQFVVNFVNSAAEPPKETVIANVRAEFPDATDECFIECRVLPALRRFKALATQLGQSIHLILDDNIEKSVMNLTDLAKMLRGAQTH
jgi:hypothetical protein